MLAQKVSMVAVDSGWAKNSVNAVIFRKNSIVTYEKTQYIAYYDPDQYLVLAKRALKQDKWDICKTKFKGNAEDAHNAISIMTDGEGFLHVAWDHHDDTLRYAKGIAPGSLTLTDKISMTGKNEYFVSYPEFYKNSDGDLFFLYRDGASGNGNLVINKYNTAVKEWTQVQNGLIDGEGLRNAYWQTFIDEAGTIHISWVWRETWDVETNHDMCYARSKDGGETWENSKGEVYNLPITLETAEVAYAVPQNSELINQTSMGVDRNQNPVIATYFKKDSNIPQYHLIYNDGAKWHASQITDRKDAFSLSGGGTKKIPISRPQILLRKIKNKQLAILLFRDEERGNKPSVVINNQFPEGSWKLIDLYDENLGSWEPTFDTELWKNKGIVHIFIQKVVQEDGEGLSDNEPQPVKVLEWEPSIK